MPAKVITTVGQALIARMMEGKLIPTRAQAGATQLSVSQLPQMTVIPTVKKDLSITEQISKNNIIKLRCQLNNSGLETGFALWQIGLYAKIEGDTTDTLLMVIQLDVADYVPATSESPEYINDFVINLVIDNNADVVAEIDVAAIVTVGHLASALTGKADSNHTHSNYADTTHTHDDRYYTESELNTKLNAKANTSHTHTIANTTNLQTTLDAKMPKTGGNFTGNITVASKQVYHTGNITISTAAPTAVLAANAQHQKY